ncbi:amino acid ABC transporter permease [Notoacmeibacter sp. MSK16QG-6]|uniref:amino acid ABC transporter permease n=1 Tax=Notoacmeibacter sp. MSK16QG-6 TaxID=2957982 RepID=UPI00209CA5AA|nr:amino acid ABC transporter permease [Notoacmeibacter sp. MSK16QG-6]MCP1201013.1 amino acid ABC transporter permease [Notoacmeibacter sp. MSK16QG-6]
MQLIIDSLPLLWSGLLTTFKLAILTLLLTAIISLFVGIMSVSRYRLLRILALIYVEFFRDIPLVVNLLFVYFGAPLIGLSLDPFSAALVSFTTWGSANGSEIIRGGFNAIPKHQRESALALGLRPSETLFMVLLPQIVLPILPPFTGLFSLLIQATSLASMVGATEFLRTAKIIVERTTLMTGESPAFMVFGFVLCVYFCICYCLNLFTAWLERKITVARTVHQNDSASDDEHGAAAPASAGKA